MRSSSEAGAHSIARSACSGNSSSSTTGQSMFCSFSQSARLAGIAGGDGGKAQPRQTVGQPARDRAADGAQSCNGDTCRHGHLLHSSYVALRAATSRIDPSDSGCQPCRNARWTMPGRCIAVSLAGLLALAGNAVAQDWPTRPLTLVVPYAAGGSVDGNGRTMAQRMGEILGQQVVIENVGGAGGMTGSLRVVARAAGRLSDGDRQSRQPRRQPDALQAAALQFGDGLRAGRPRQSGPLSCCWCARTFR